MGKPFWLKRFFLIQQSDERLPASNVARHGKSRMAAFVSRTGANSIGRRTFRFRPGRGRVQF